MDDNQNFPMKSEIVAAKEDRILSEWEYSSIVKEIKSSSFTRGSTRSEWRKTVAAKCIITKQMAPASVYGALYSLSSFSPVDLSMCKYCFTNCGVSSKAAIYLSSSFAKSYVGSNPKFIISGLQLDENGVTQLVVRNQSISLPLILSALVQNHSTSDETHSIPLKKIAFETGTLYDKAAAENLMQILAAAFFCPICSPIVPLVKDMEAYIFANIGVFVKGKEKTDIFLGTQKNFRLVITPDEKINPKLCMPRKEDLPSMMKHIREFKKICKIVTPSEPNENRKDQSCVKREGVLMSIEDFRKKKRKYESQKRNPVINSESESSDSDANNLSVELPHTSRQDVNIKQKHSNRKSSCHHRHAPMAVTVKVSMIDQNSNISQSVTTTATTTSGIPKKLKINTIVPVKLKTTSNNIC